MMMIIMMMMMIVIMLIIVDEYDDSDDDDDLCYTTKPVMPTSAMSVFTSCVYAAASVSNPMSASSMAKCSL